MVVSDYGLIYYAIVFVADHISCELQYTEALQYTTVGGYILFINTNPQESWIDQWYKRNLDPHYATHMNSILFFGGVSGVSS